MNLSTRTTQDLYALRRRAELCRDWTLARLCTEELCRRGQFGERKAA